MSLQVLAIGNSFSQDATRYLHQIARADGFSLQIVNLYIGGCTLERHFRNSLSDDKAYVLEVNGENSGFFVSLKDALLNRKWDIITLQQASHESIDYQNYQPYLTELSAYIKKHAPTAKQAIHQTWAYAQDAEKLTNLGYDDQGKMYQDLKVAYEAAAKDINPDTMIPSGLLFQNLLKHGIDKLHRDGYHATMGLGRYALALLWYHILTGKDVTKNTFRDFDQPVTEEEISIIKQCVNEL